MSEAAKKTVELSAGEKLSNSDVMRVFSFTAKYFSLPKVSWSAAFTALLINAVGSGGTRWM